MPKAVVNCPILLIGKANCINVLIPVLTNAKANEMVKKPTEAAINPNDRL